MDNYQYLTTVGDLREMGHVLCDLQKDCRFCPVNDKCEPMCNGFIEWLKEDAKCGKSMKQSD